MNEEKKLRQQRLNAASQQVLQAHADVMARVHQLTSVWIVMRCVCTVVLLAMGLLGYLELSGLAASLILSVVVAFFFAWLLRKGLRFFAWLGVVGAVYGMLNFLVALAGVGLYLAAAPLLLVALGAMMLDALTQFVVMVLLIRDADYKALAAELDKLRSTIH